MLLIMVDAPVLLIIVCALVLLIMIDALIRILLPIAPNMILRTLVTDIATKYINFSDCVCEFY